MRHYFFACCMLIMATTAVAVSVKMHAYRNPHDSDFRPNEPAPTVDITVECPMYYDQTPRHQHQHRCMIYVHDEDDNHSFEFDCPDSKLPAGHERRVIIESLVQCIKPYTHKIRFVHQCLLMDFANNKLHSYHVKSLPSLNKDDKNWEWYIFRYVWNSPYRPTPCEHYS